MFKNFERLSEKTREILFGPREIEFENGIKLLTRIGKDEPILKFMKGNEEVFDLTTLTPEGTEIIFDPENKWQASAKRKEIHIGKFTGADCVLSFLHEVGHLKRPEDEDISNTADSQYYKEKLKEGEGVSSEELAELLKKVSQEIILGERNAWAYSLRQARNLEREHGIDVLGKIGNAKQVKEFIDSFLYAYKDGYREEFNSLNIFTEEEIEEFLKRPK